MTRQEAPGWYGKLATQGDFVSRRLPDDWVRACDQWLSSCISTSRSQLGSRWLEVYLNAPVWRFAWGPGVADHRWWFGVLMPSCDNVGRYFPLLVAQPRERPPDDRIGLDHLDLWWTHVARAALGTLAETATLETFEEALSHAPPWPGPASVAVPAAVAGAGGRWRQATPAGAGLSELALARVAADMQQRLQRTSFWWPLGPDGDVGSYTMVPGLPPPEAYAEMLCGGW